MMFIIWIKRITGMSIFNLDIHTIIVLLVLGNIIAVIVLAAYKIGKTATTAYIEFITGKLFQGTAWALIGMRGNIPDIISANIGNTILLAGIALETLALITVNKNSIKWHYAYLFFVISGITAFWIFASTPNMRVGVSSLANCVFYLSASVEMIRSRGSSRLRFTLGILCGLLSFVLFLRSWYGFFSYTEFSLMTPGYVQSLTFLQAYSLMFIGGIGFLLMFKEHYDTMLVESEEKYRTLVEKANEAIVIIKDERFVFANRRMSEILELPENEIISREAEEFINPEDRDSVMGNYKKRLEGEFVPKNYDFRLDGAQNKETWVTISASRITWKGGNAVMALLTDITERKNLEREKEKIINDLQKALADVKALSGLLPICSSCKKIRDDKGYWNQIEVYIRDHSEADFSHGLCPDCVTKLYPGLKGSKVSGENS